MYINSIKDLPNTIEDPVSDESEEEASDHDKADDGEKEAEVADVEEVEEENKDSEKKEVDGEAEWKKDKDKKVSIINLRFKI